MLVLNENYYPQLSLKLNKIFKRILRKISSEIIIEQFFWNPPFNYVENITINNICSYLNINKDYLYKWVIVGVYRGDEIPKILKKYKNVKIDAFECSPKYAKKLNTRFKNNKRVKIINKAVTSFTGETTFYETNLNGNGSLLPIGELSKSHYGSYQKEQYKVKTTSLDEYYKNKEIDILWIDVQGAEKFVLEGADEVLKKLKGIFIEVSINSGFYQDSVIMDSISKLLNGYGFHLILLGTDTNLTGNALYIKSQ